MSETPIFIIGAIIFAITVYGAVMGGGLALTRAELDQDDQLRRRADRSADESGLPFDAKY